MTKEVMQQEQDDSFNYVQKVIEALYENSDPVSVEAAELLERINAKQEQNEPWGTYMGHRLTPKGTKEFWGFADAPLTEGTKLYTTPQTKEWVGLTDEEKSEIYNMNYIKYAVHVDFVDFLIIYTEIEAKLKEKNR